ncbi:DNA alkylation repair protein [Streptomyces sp. NPDC046465]|uniref:DNA alkylation repair protein n=1 Tax=Streptomyces sp. NPDC046465 TaxID=3155810 RepID=UPI0033DE03B5
MADFKDELSPDLIRRLGGDLAQGSASFDRAAFEQRACSGIGDLELKARIDWIAQALAATLPAVPEEADRLIRAALDGGGLTGWASMPVNAFVASALLDRPDLALPLLAALTSRYTAEFAIRPFVDAHYEHTMKQLRAWTTDPDEHVRRLVSEGTRPRLPWAQRIPRFIADPAPALALLEPLVNDESLYVRRSVANHLNDISKDHPDVVLETARRWSGSSTHGDFVVRHGLRTLVKRGHPEALAILGFDHQAPIEITDLACSPSTISVGEATTITFSLHATDTATAAIDYLVHYQGVRGPKAGKVFKLTARNLPAGQAVHFSRQHRFANLSVRTIHPGPHRIEIQANGRILGATEVHITPTRPAQGST